MSRPHPPSPTITVAPFVLLGLLTIATVGGPLLIYLMLKGGERPAWPPDRPLEWWTFGLSIAMYLVILAACLSTGILRWRRTVAALRPRREKAQGAGQ
jgi:drug/metabolite transporter (DMT)-like permease